MMTSNRNNSSSSSTTTTLAKARSRRIDDDIGVGVLDNNNNNTNGGLRVRNPSCSASSTLSSTSSSSSSSSTALSNNEQSTKLSSHSCDFIDVLVVYPNGFQTLKKLDVRKAIYDILIELAATGKLLPSNYTLKLFSSTTHDNDDESNNNNNNFNDDAIIEYTPNQTIGQLNPTKIKIIPKTSTLKHNFQNNYEISNHHHHFSTLNNQINSSGSAANSSSRVQTLSNNYSSTPFELTNRVEVNLPFNQKTAVRVRLDISLDDLLSTICKEAALERSRYDLVINGSRPSSMLDPLSSFNTKEVTLVLKHSETAYVKNNLSSKASHTSQNSTKSRTHLKISSQQRTSPQIENNSPLNRSKSELDLSSSGSSDLSQKEKRNPLSQKSSNTGSMFGFFTRKRHSKSKNSLCASHSNLVVSSSIDASRTLSVAKSDEKEEKSFGKYSTSYVSNSSLSKTKKRVAPPPPITPKSTPTEKLSVSNGNSHEVSVVTVNPASASRPKPEVIDSEMLEKIKMLTKKKQKKTAAPLPPQSLSPCSNSPSSQSSSHEINYSSPDQADIKTSTTAKKLFLSMSESSSSPTTYPSPSLSEASSSVSNQERVRCDNEKRLHISKISNSLVMPVMKTSTTVVNNEEEKETGEVIVKRNSSIQSSSESSEVDYTKSADYKYRNDCESVHDSSISSTNASNNCNHSETQRDEEPREHSIIEIVRNPPEEFQEIEKSPQFNEPDLSLIVSNRSSFGRMKNKNGAVIDSKIAFSSEENSNSSALEDQHHFIQRQQSINEDDDNNLPPAPKDQEHESIDNHHQRNSSSTNLHLDTRIPNVFVSANDENVHYREHLRNDFEQELADLSSLSDHDQRNSSIHLENKPTTQVTMSTPPKRCTAIIEVRPEYVQSSLIRISEADVKPSIQKPLELCMADSYHFDGQIVRQNSPRVLIDSSEQQSNGLKLRSPSSPLPQFPAICENEVNEMHGNYVVVRTGDIIEKNGIYYSSDGTIRGYSGTVKKMAGSKTLNEVFLKQQELEQQHEKEYQIELEKKRLQQIPEVSVSSRKEEKEKENQHPLPPPPPPPPSALPVVVASPPIATAANSSPIFSGVQAAKQRLSLSNIIANEKKNYTLSSNSNIFKSAGTTPFRKYSQTIKHDNNDSIENELTKKLENRRLQIANQMSTSQQQQQQPKNENHLRIDTSSTGKTTVAGSSLASSSNHSEESSSPMSSPSVNSPSKTSTYNNTTTTSFVMSAKFRNTSYQQQFGPAKATITAMTISRNEESNYGLPPPPPPPLPPSMFADKPQSPVVVLKSATTTSTFTPPPPPLPAKPQSKSMTLPPAVAPKNFKPDTLVSISKKNQLLDARESLLESIKGFNISNLKRVSNQSD